MVTRSNRFSLASMAVGLLTGSVLVTACPSAAERGMEWLDSEAESDTSEALARDGAFGIEPPDEEPEYVLSRTLVASEDSSRHVGGWVPMGEDVTIAVGPVFVTDYLVSRTNGGGEPIWLASAGDCDLDPADTLEMAADEFGQLGFTGARLFVDEGEVLCGNITFQSQARWSGFVPYY